MRAGGRWQDVATAAGLLGADGTARPTIFAEMSALAVATSSVNLGQGFPDADGPDAVKEAARRAIADGVNQYPPGPGVPELRRAIAEHQRRHYGLEHDSDTEVLVTTGATEAIAAAVLALTEPGDEVVALEPLYDSYAAVIAMAGATLRTVPMVATADGFRPDLSALADAVTGRTRLLLLNSPHNPTGAVLRRSELEAFARVALAQDLVVVTDEVYEHLVLDDATHVPLATRPGMAERTLTISSSGKTFSFTGWKIGWVCGPAPLIDAVRTVKQFLTYTSGAPFQPAVAHGLALEATAAPGTGFVASLTRSLASRRDLLVDGLLASGFAPVPVQGTYFVVADAGEILDRHGLPDAAALCRELPRLCGVVAVPVSAFTVAGSAADAALRRHVRFTFTKSEETLTEAARRLAALRTAGVTAR
jgi:N-succinyldiaminopimelate aminotransferase